MPEYTFEEVVKSEEAGVLPKFDSKIIWALGSKARELAVAKYPDADLKIDITSTTGETLFHTIVGENTNAVNENWVRRKRNAVMKFQMSSFAIGKLLAKTDRTLDQMSHYDEKDYATHGGGVPIKIKDVHGVVAVMTISGLEQSQDHFLVIETLKHFA